MLSNKLSNKTGFTLLETIVSIGLLFIVIASIMSLLGQSVGAARSAKDQVAAFYLAQDAVEYVRNVRDANAKAGESNWLENLTSCVDANCKIDTTILDDFSSAVTSCSGACPSLRKDAATDRYGYDASWTESPYARTVRLVTRNTDEVEINVTISWNSGFAARAFTVKQAMLNWTF